MKEWIKENLNDMLMFLALIVGCYLIWGIKVAGIGLFIIALLYFLG